MRRLDVIACIAAGGLLTIAPAIADPPPLPVPLPRPGPAPGPAVVPPRPLCVVGETCGEIHWDFEDRDGDRRGDLRGWTASGAFASGGTSPQPTYGDNVSSRRQLAGAARNDTPLLAAMRKAQGLGGDYWDTGWPIGQQGDYWLGTYEARPSPAIAYDTTAGDAASGELISPVFQLQKRFIRFLAGGSCNPGVRVVLEQRVTRRAVRSSCAAQQQAADDAHAAAVARCPGPQCSAAIAAERLAQGALTRCLDARTTSYEDVAAPIWEPVRVENGLRNNDPRLPIFIDYQFTPTACKDAMTRVSWSVEPIWRVGNTATYRLRVIDGATDAHINVDDVWITDRTAVPEPSPPLWGFADLHTHPAAHRAYNGLLIAGTAAGATPGAWPRSDGQFWADLAGCKDPNHPCHRSATTSSQCNVHAAPTAISLFTRGRLPMPATGTGDALDSPRERDGDFLAVSPTVNAAIPSWYNASHQMMHVNWLRRAYEGGLRLLVADAVNNRALAWLLISDPGIVPQTDDDAIEQQFDHIRALAAANASWMEIVLSPGHARRVIGQGKLAIVLGSEVDSYAGCDNVVSFVRESGANTPALTTTCTRVGAVRTLDHFIARGQRKITPIHLADNAFGGMAVYNDLFNTASNWLNRGDKGDLCADPRMPTSVCRRTAIPDPGILYPPFTQCSCHRGVVTVPCPVERAAATGVACPNEFYVSFFGYAQVRDGSTNLGPRGFQLGRSQGYLTLKYNPVPFATIGGCGSFQTCQAPDQYASALPGYGDGKPDVNAVGLTTLGRNFLGDIMARGMLLDVQHMSDLALNEVIGLIDPGTGVIPGGGVAITARGDLRCGRENPDAMARDPACADALYPVMSSHAVVRNIDRAGSNENMRTARQLARIYQAGGVFGVGTIGGTLPFGESYQQVRSIAAGAGVALGSDLNGGDAGAPPRLLRHVCHPAGQRPTGRTVRYAGRPEPYTLPACGPAGAATSEFPADGAPALQPMVTAGVTFDINAHGMSNIGMYPDYLQDLRATGVARDQLGSLFRAAERFVQQWEKSCRLAQASDAAASNASCRCDPGTAEGRAFCPAGSPGLTGP